MRLSWIRECVVDAALRLYPRAWRDRYGEEVKDLVEGGPVTLRTFTDLFLNAIRERMRSDVMWRLVAGAGLTLVPFLFLFFLMPIAMTGRWPADPVLGVMLLVVSPGPLFDFWLMPAVVAAVFSLALRATAGAWAASHAAAAACGATCAVACHALLIIQALPGGRGVQFLLSADWWLEVYPQVLVLYLGFALIGIIVHRLIAVPFPSGTHVPAQ